MTRYCFTGHVGPGLLEEHRERTEVRPTRVLRTTPPLTPLPAALDLTAQLAQLPEQENAHVRP